MNKIKIFSIVIILVALIIVAGIFLFEFSKVEGEYFESNGIRIHYTIEGEGEPVLLVHGFAVNADLNWRKPGMNRMLRKHYKVISIDNRGHGYSDKPHDKEAYGIRMVEDINNLMDHLNIQKAHLVGYSMGGFISLKSAVLYPEQWQTVTIMGSGWENFEKGRAFQALKMTEDAYKNNTSLAPAMLHFEGKEPGWLAKALVLCSGLINDTNALIAIIEGIDQLIITEEELRSISIPMCGIVGDEDPFFTGAKELMGMIPDFQFHPVKGGNHLNTPQKKAAKKALLEFLQAHSFGQSL